MTGATLEELLNASIQCLWLDIEDTITTDPAAYERLSSAALKLGGHVVVVTSRLEQASDQEHSLPRRQLVRRN